MWTKFHWKSVVFDSKVDLVVYVRMNFAAILDLKMKTSSSLWKSHLSLVTGFNIQFRRHNWRLRSFAALWADTAAVGPIQTQQDPLYQQQDRLWLYQTLINCMNEEDDKKKLWR